MEWRNGRDKNIHETTTNIIFSNFLNEKASYKTKKCFGLFNYSPLISLHQKTTTKLSLPTDIMIMVLLLIKLSFFTVTSIRCQEMPPQNLTGDEDWLVALPPSEQMYIYCNSNLVHLCYTNNYNNRFTIPSDYNLNHCPDDAVDIEIGLFYNQLSFLGKVQMTSNPTTSA